MKVRPFTAQRLTNLGYDLDAVRKVAVEFDGVRFLIDEHNPDWIKLRDKRLRGLGDVVAKVTGALHIRQCGGCKKRQAVLNRMVPFH